MAPASATPRIWPGLLVCEECDAVFARQVVRRHDLLRCRRCGATLERGRGLSLQGQLALAAGAAVTFLIASFSPIVTLELNGVDSEASLYEAIRGTWRAGEEVVALLAFATAFLFPLTVIVLRLWLLAPAAAGRLAAGFVPALRTLRGVSRWSMVEVFMLGILIAVVRSAGVTNVVLGAGLFAYGSLTVLLTAMHACGHEALWRRVPLAAP